MNILYAVYGRNNGAFEELYVGESQSGCEKWLHLRLLVTKKGKTTPKPSSKKWTTYTPIATLKGHTKFTILPLYY